MRISDWSSDVCSSDLCCRIFCDGPHGYSDAGRIGKAEVPLGRHRLGSDDLDFSRPSMRVEKQSLTLGKFDIGLVAHSAFLMVYLVPGRSSDCRRFEKIGGAACRERVWQKV